MSYCFIIPARLRFLMGQFSNIFLEIHSFCLVVINTRSAQMTQIPDFHISIFCHALGRIDVIVISGMEPACRESKANLREWFYRFTFSETENLFHTNILIFIRLLCLGD